MFLSVITVTFNNLEGLRKTVASLPASAADLFEWIVINGGSGDGTVDWLASCNRPDLFWRSEPDGGFFDAMNEGIM